MGLGWARGLGCWGPQEVQQSKHQASAWGCRAAGAVGTAWRPRQAGVASAWAARPVLQPGLC